MKRWGVLNVPLVSDKAWQWKCDVCTKKWCLKCNDDTHDSTCEAYQQWKKENGMADDKFQELIDAGLLKLCPHCGTRTQKTEGTVEPVALQVPWLLTCDHN